jgi:hypothetical protein
VCRRCSWATAVISLHTTHRETDMLSPKEIDSRLATMSNSLIVDIATLVAKGYSVQRARRETPATLKQVHAVFAACCAPGWKARLENYRNLSRVKPEPPPSIDFIAKVVYTTTLNKDCSGDIVSEFILPREESMYRAVLQDILISGGYIVRASLVPIDDGCAWPDTHLQPCNCKGSAR